MEKETQLNMNNIDLMKAQEIYGKKLKKASPADKFKLRCWIDYCKKNSPITYEEYLSTQSLNKFLDKLHYGIVKYEDILTEQELETALTESFYE